MRTRTIALVCVVTLWVAPASRAIILCKSADPAVNTEAPTGWLENAGWQTRGDFNGYSGTAIGPSYFLTAAHMGGKIGDPFTLQGVSYPTLAFFSDSTDLQVWKVAGVLPAWAALYTGSPGSEIDQLVILFGRGTQRGAPVLSPGGANTIAGWLWGTDDRIRRWGTGAVSRIFTDTTYGASLVIPFDCDQGHHVEASGISNGDSGGGTFIYSQGAWYLAGVNLSYDGPFSASPDLSNSFNATMRIGTGFFAPVDGLLNSGLVDKAPAIGNSFATEIAPRLTFLSQFAGK